MAPKILVVDDEESIRFVFRNLLSKDGCHVVAAQDYDSALKAIADADFDLIISDIILGEHSGIEILRKVKEHGMRCPVIMVTGRPEIDTASEAVRLGAFDYLSKPVKKEALLRVAGLALSRKKLLDEKSRLEAENERILFNLEAIFDSLMDAVVTVDADMCLMEANRAAGSLCGFSPIEDAGKKWDAVGVHCSKRCLGILQKTLETKKSVREVRVECDREGRSGQVVLLSSVPLIYDGKRFSGGVLAVRDISRLTSLEREIKERYQFHNIIGKSKKMQAVFALLEDLSHTETTVLITGESGTGKELVAKALHYGGVRAERTLVNVNCSALSENLLESDLFGHVKGAFTGAVRNREGRFQKADGGTIFLDEIGDITPHIQLKLLRVVQEREFEKVGASLPIKVDVRLIAATNRNLKEMVRKGEFREDLYYRLKVVEVALPPLREKSEDIPFLLRHFLKIFRKKFKKKIEGVSEEVLSALMNYHWPGNVRELEHAVEHAFVLCHGRTIRMEHLPPELRAFPPTEVHPPIKASSDVRRNLLEALNKTDWNKAKAARLLGISRPTLYQKIKTYRLIPPH